MQVSEVKVGFSRQRSYSCLLVYPIDQEYYYSLATAQAAFSEVLVGTPCLCYRRNFDRQSMGPMSSSVEVAEPVRHV